MTAHWRAISFDLDGTLVDTGEEITIAANRALRDLWLPEQPAAAVLRHVGHGGRALMQALLADLAATGVDLDEAHACFDAHYGELAGEHCTTYAGAGEALGRLRAAGIGLACLTNKSERFARRVLASTDLLASIDLVVGGDTLDVRKPDAGVVRHALAFFDCLPTAAAHVGDSRTDVEAARAGGVAAWAVPWGFDGGRPVADAAPDRVFASFAEIADFALAPRSSP